MAFKSQELSDVLVIAALQRTLRVVDDFICSFSFKKYDTIPCLHDFHFTCNNFSKLFYLNLYFSSFIETITSIFL